MAVLDKPDSYQDAYRDKMDALHTASDALFNITSYRHKEPGKPDVWVRDASRAHALGSPARVRHDAPAIEKNNALLRGLSRLRAIDYAISQTESTILDVNGKRDSIRKQLKEAFESLCSMPPEKIPEAEKRFNTALIKHLHEANLTEGCLTYKHAEALLFHYHVLASVIDPAMPLVTLTRDEEAGILQSEVQYPVTVKTEIQKEALKTLKTVVAMPLEKERNAHTIKKLAMQRADACFADSMAADDRMLSAHARKMHLVGVRNAFIVKTSTHLTHSPEQADSMCEAFEKNPTEAFNSTADDLFWIARTGVPVFVGDGESEAAINRHTQENLRQIELAGESLMGEGKAKGIHLAVLNTDLMHQKQDRMLKGLRHEILEQENSPHAMSNIPVNDIGTAFYTARLSLAIKEAFNQLKHRAYLLGAPGEKASRLEIAVVAMFAAIKAGYLSVVNCASGQDRTGSVVEKLMQDQTLQVWIAHTEKTTGEKLTPKAIEAQRRLIQNMRARGFNAAVIASHMAVGSPGMKRESRANNWFDAKRTFGVAAERELYLESADTNTTNIVGGVSFLRTPSEVARLEFIRKQDEFEELLRPLGVKPSYLLRSVKDAGQALNASLTNFKLVDYQDYKKLGILGRTQRNMQSALKGTFRDTTGKKSAKDLAYMSATLDAASDAIKGLTEPNDLQKVERAIGRLELLQAKLPGHEKVSLKIGAFIITAVIALLIASMFAFPPFGAAVLGGAAAVGALGGLLGAVAQFSAFSVLLTTGWYTTKALRAMWNESKEKGQAEVVGQFKEIIQQEKERQSLPEEKQPQASSGSSEHTDEHHTENNNNKFSPDAV